MKRYIASTNDGLQVREPEPGTIADVEWDSNADTCCLGSNFVILGHTHRIAEVFPYDDTMPSIQVPIVSGATAYDCPKTNQTYILVVNEGLYYGKKLNHSLFNQMQVRSFGIDVWDNPFDRDRPFGMEVEDLFIPFQTKGIKVLFKTRAPTEEELERCRPHIKLTSRTAWNPHELQISGVGTGRSIQEVQADPRSNTNELRNLDPILDCSSWRQIGQLGTNYDRRSLDVPTRATFESSERHPRVSPELLSERWGISKERAVATMQATLQKGTRSALLPLARRYRADRMYDRPLLKGKFSTDTAYFKCKSLRGNIASQIYFHKCGFYANYNISRTNDAQIGPTLPRFISDYGIPQHLTMDGAAVQKGRKTTFMETIRRANIDWHISGPYRPEENPVEGGIRELKRRFYRLIIKQGVPMRLWDFVLDYVVDIMNVTVNYSKYSSGRVPLEIITGITPDISEYMDFTIYCWVFFRTDGGLGTNEIGRWLGVSHRVGPVMTYWVLPKSGIPISTDTVQAVTQAEQETEAVKDQMAKWKEAAARVLEAKTTDVVWRAKDEVPSSRLFDLESEDEEFQRNFNMSVGVPSLEPIPEGEEDEEEAHRQGTNPLFDDGYDLNAPTYVGMQVGLKRGTDGEIIRASVKRQAVDDDGRVIGVPSSNPLLDSRQYEVEYEDGTKEILTANLLAESILEQVDEHGHKHRMMEEINGHRKSDEALNEDESWYRTKNGTKRRKHTTKGWELFVIWKDGSSNMVPLSEMKESFPIETAEYAVDRGLQDDPAFIWWIPHVLRKRNRIIKKVKSKYWERTHKYGIKIPHSIKEAIAIDQENGNTLWQDAIRMEMANNRVAFEEYNGDVKKLVGYKKITGHMIFDVKLGENFRRKARYVADGHKTTAPASMTYSTVVARDSVRILLMIAALNDLDLQAADIQNAFLTAPNLEKCYMVAGPEFLEEEGKTFIVKRALYGLKSAPLAFRTFLAEHVGDLGFFPSEADPDVWMRPAVTIDNVSYYEYILCYVDDILCISAKAEEVMKQLQTKFKFKNDKIAPPENYLGASVKKKNVDGYEMWSISSYEYVKAAVKNVQEAIKDKHWKLPTRNTATPMNNTFVPELDGTAELNDEQHQYYQELIGVLRWATELGRVDILHEVSLLSQYQACPRQGHMEQVMHIFAYLRDHPRRSIYMHPGQSGLNVDQVRSSREEFQQMYRGAKEELPRRMPVPRGKAVETEAWVDASHAANKKTRKSHTGYLIFVNSAPIVWYSKRQNTVEASTFGSEFIALKACVEAIVYLRYKLRMFGIPIEGDKPTLIICDNESVVKNSTLVESTLNKKHNSIAYHHVRWNVAAGVISLAWMNGEYNLADLFTKRLAAQRRNDLLDEFTY